MDIISVLVLIALLAFFNEGETVDAIVCLLFKMFLYAIMFLFLTASLMAV